MKAIITHNLETCDSTNKYAWSYFTENFQGTNSFQPQLFTSKVQTAGKGRQGRPWNSSIAGNLYASLLLKPEFSQLSLIPIMAGIAAAQAIAPYLKPEHGFHIKWPNDLRVGNKKMGGILCESKILAETCEAVVIGFGCNLLKAPENLEIPVTALREYTDAHITPERLAPVLAENFLKLTLELQKNGPQYIRQEWLLYAKLEKFSNYRTHDAEGKTIEIKAQDITLNGSLMAINTHTNQELVLDQPLLLI